MNVPHTPPPPLGSTAELCFQVHNTVHYHWDTDISTVLETTQVRKKDILVFTEGVQTKTSGQCKVITSTALSFHSSNKLKSFIYNYS